MNAFEMFLRLGFDHITDLNGLDHILFLFALCGVYAFKQWKKVFAVVTVFTVTHSITLGLAAFNVVKVDSGFIEFLIPLTILFTGLFNLTKSGSDTSGYYKIIVSAVFGLIHGFGFSGFYRMIRMDSKPWYESYLPFNLGIEIGQLLIVLIVLLLSFLFQDIFKVSKKSWNIFIAGAVSSISITLIIKNWPF